MIKTKTQILSKIIPPKGVPVIDAINTIITVVSIGKDIYNYFADDKKK